MSELKLQQCRLDGRYDILECLGRGSYAEVYLARDAAAGGGSPHTVVIKALNLFLQGSIDLELEHTLIENFRNEAVALDRVRHPNIINRLGHGTAIDMAGQTFHYLVLEYLPGGDMAALCRSQPLALDRALYYLDQICDGLAHAHEHDVIHRDIKPQNLLLTADREVVKIADFGVAKIEAGEGLITRVGTDVYAAPEHHPLMAAGGLLGTGSLTSPVTHLTPAADVYSLAKTAYMLLTGEAPRRFSQRPITDLPAPFAGAPWASFVLRVLRRGTETNPAKRYQSVRAFWDELSDALMPKTQLLSQPNGEETRALTQVKGHSQHLAPLPPEPSPAQFERPDEQPRLAGGAKVRPRIVVPVALAQPPAAQHAKAAEHSIAPTPREQKVQKSPPQEVAARPKERGGGLMPRKTWFTEHARPWIVAVLLLAGFALLLLGIQYQVRSRQRSAAAARGSSTATTGAPAANAGSLQAGREMTTTTNVNLRSGPGRNFNRIGEVEGGSRVRLLQVNGNWCEVEIRQRGFPRIDEESADRGWLDGTRLR
jgi:serine/threonine protein kinase